MGACTKIVCNFGLSGCNMVKEIRVVPISNELCYRGIQTGSHINYLPLTKWRNNVGVSLLPNLICLCSKYISFLLLLLLLYVFYGPFKITCLDTNHRGLNPVDLRKNIQTA